MSHVVHQVSDEGCGVGSEVPCCRDKTHGHGAVFRRREFGDHRGGDRVVRTDGDSDEEAQDQQLDGSGDECAEDGQDRDDDKVEDEHFASSDEVGDPAADGGTQEEPQEGCNSEEAGHTAGQFNVVSQQGEGNTDDSEDVSFEERATAGECNDASQRAVHLQVFEIDDLFTHVCLLVSVLGASRCGTDEAMAGRVHILPRRFLTFVVSPG